MKMQWKRELEKLLSYNTMYSFLNEKISTNLIIV